jgi:hypothetical protein
MLETSELTVLKEISAKLDRLIAVMAITNKAEDEHADVLINLGVDAKTISAITGITTNAVAIRKTRLKKSSKTIK